MQTFGLILILLEIKKDYGTLWLTLTKLGLMELKEKLLLSSNMVTLSQSNLFTMLSTSL